MRRGMRVVAALCVVAGGMAACTGGTLPDGADRKSQPALVRQRMGGTEIAVVYNRPAARGRHLFGGIVPYDSVWNPGADEATRLETTHPIRVGGQELPAGKYSLWAVPGPRLWTLIFSRAHDVPHVPYPAGKDALRIQVRPEVGRHTESLEFAFPLATPDSALLEMRWGTTVLPIPIRPANR